MAFRHFNIQLLAYVTQSFKAIPPIVRNNATDVIIMKQSNAKELEKIMEEYKAPVQVYWCTTKDGKYYVNYYDPQFEKEKEKVKK